MPVQTSFSELEYAATTQAEVHLQLFGALLADDLLNGLFLICAEEACLAHFPVSFDWSDGCPSALFVLVNRAPHRGVTQPRHLNQFHDLGASLVKPHHLLATLVQLLQRLVSRVFFVHPDMMPQANETYTSWGRINSCSPCSGWPT